MIFDTLYTMARGQGRISLGHGLQPVDHDHKNPISFSLTTFGHACKTTLMLLANHFDYIATCQISHLNTFSSKEKLGLDSTSL